MEITEYGNANIHYLRVYYNVLYLYTHIIRQTEKIIKCISQIKIGNTRNLQNATKLAISPVFRFKLWVDENDRDR